MFNAAALPSFRPLRFAELRGQGTSALLTWMGKHGQGEAIVPVVKVCRYLASQRGQLFRHSRLVQAVLEHSFGGRC